MREAKFEKQIMSYLGHFAFLCLLFYNLFFILREMWQENFRQYIFYSVVLILLLIYRVIDFIKYCRAQLRCDKNFIYYRKYFKNYMIGKDQIDWARLEGQTLTIGFKNNKKISFPNIKNGEEMEKAIRCMVRLSEERPTSVLKMEAESYHKIEKLPAIFPVIIFIFLVIFLMSISTTAERFGSFFEPIKIISLIVVVLAFAANELFYSLLFKKSKAICELDKRAFSKGKKRWFAADYKKCLIEKEDGSLILEELGVFTQKKEVEDKETVLQNIFHNLYIEDF